MSETTKTTGVQDEAEKEVPETEEPVTEPVEESPEATAGENPEGEKEADAADEKESKGKTSFFGKKKKDNKLEQQIEDLTDRLNETWLSLITSVNVRKKKNPACISLERRILLRKSFRW